MIPQRWLELVPEELRFERVPFDHAKNAHPLLKQAARAYNEEDEGQTWEQIADLDREEASFPHGEEGQLLERCILLNEGALALLDEAVARGRLQFAPWPRRMPVDAPEGELHGMGLLTPLLHLCQLKLARAKLDAARGRTESAVENIFGLLRLGDLLREGEGVLVEHLVGTGIQRLGRAGVRWLLSQSVSQRTLEALLIALSASRDRPAMLKALRIELSSFVLPCLADIPDTRDPARLAEALAKDCGEIDEATRCRFVAGIEGLLEGHPAPFDREETVRAMASLFSAISTNVKGGWKDRVPVDENSPRISEVWPEALRPNAMFWISVGMASLETIPPEDIRKARQALAKIKNPFGMLLVYEVLEGLVVNLAEHVTMNVISSHADREATRTLIALRLHLLRKGELPGSLADLVTEKLLPAPPVDPFTGGPLGYSREWKLLWSAGPEGKEDGRQGLLDEDGDPRPFLWPIRNPAAENR